METGNIMKKFVIVGSGAAGIAAIEAIRNVDNISEIILVQGEADGYYSRPGLAYYLSKEISEDLLFPFSQKDFQKLQVTLFMGIANKLDATSKTLHFVSGKTLKYDKLLIAVGAQAVKTKIPGHDLDGIIYLDIIKSTKSILKRARKAKSAIVIGGGITALEIVEGLLANKVKVHFFLRKDRYWGNVLDHTESKLVEERLKEDGVSIYYNTEAEEVLGKKGKVIGVITKNGENIACQLVAFAIGVRPRIQIAKNSGIHYEKGILVNSFLETNLPDVYAAGDVTQVFDPRVGKAVVDSLWDLARKQGTVAGKNMTGMKISYSKDVPFNVTRLAGLTTSIIGSVGIIGEEKNIEIVRGESEAWQHIPDAIVSQNNFENNSIRLVIGENNILGAVVMGDQTLSDALHQIINKEIDISGIRNILINNKTEIIETLALFWKNWKMTNA